MHIKSGDFQLFSALLVKAEACADAVQRVGVRAKGKNSKKMGDESAYYDYAHSGPLSEDEINKIENKSDENPPEDEEEDEVLSDDSELKEDIQPLPEDDFEKAANKHWEKKRELLAYTTMCQTSPFKLKDLTKFSDDKDEVMNWNTEFQKLLEDLWEASAASQTAAKDWNFVKLKRSHALSSLAREFLNCAELFAKTIIREQILPEQLRTVKSATSTLKGIAGGSKFLAFGILFKFMDVHTARTLYGTEENAMKATKLDFQGCAAVTDSIVTGIRTPLMSLITYRGCRILAMSVLPIQGEKTQVYGTANAGAKVLNEDEKFNEYASDLAKSFNLKSHKVKDRWIHTGVDCEGHRGHDGRYYMVNLDFRYSSSSMWSSD
jgi:hypothetical protein